AGITNFQTVSAELPGPGQVSLVFNIRDLGDGILDSAVILDNLRLSFVESLDVNVPELIRDGGINDDPAALRAANQRVRGVVADGVSQVLLRSRLPGPGVLEYDLEED